MKLFPGKTLSNSEMMDFRVCKRHWWLKWERKLYFERSGPSAAGLGTFVHLGIEADEEAFLQGILDDDEEVPAWQRVMSERYETERVTVPEAKLKDYDKQFKLACVMVEGYIEWAAEEGIHEKYEILGNETELEMPIELLNGEPARVVGKMDQRVLRLTDGRKLFRDYKTVQNFSDLLKTASRAEQFKLYELLNRANEDGEEGRTDGGQWVMLRKVGRTKTAKPPFYMMHESRYNDRQLDSMLERVRSIGTSIVETRAKLAAGWDHRHAVPPTPTRDCSWRCEFSEVCPMFDDSHSRVDEALEAVYVYGDPYDRYTQTKQEETS